MGINREERGFLVMAGRAMTGGSIGCARVQSPHEGAPFNNGSFPRSGLRYERGCYQSP